MTLEFSSTYEAAMNRQQMRLELQRQSQNVRVYIDMQENMLRAATEAEQEIQDGHENLKTLLENASSPDAETSMNAADQIGALKKKNPTEYTLFIKASLRNDFHDLTILIKDYVRAVVEHEVHNNYGANRDDTLDVLSQKENLGVVRRSAHNALISHLQTVIRHCENVGIDTSWKNVVGFRTGKKEERSEIQLWAESVADYLVTLSQTTR
jgi:hypothetical protein